MNYRQLVYAVFVISGISGLMYEVVWLRMLSRITGVTIYATATVLAAFMSGMALGSIIFGRYADSRRDPLRIYALLEVLIAVSALLVPLAFTSAIPLYRRIYELSGENMMLTSLLRGVVSFLCILVPTTMMGGTLPILTSCLVRRDARFASNLSLLYGLNTLGAVCGVLLGGFVTIGSLGEMATIFCAVGLNFLVASAAYYLHHRDTASAEQKSQTAASGEMDGASISPYSDSIRRCVPAAFAVSGFTALAYEVIWTRQLILFLRTSVYAFSGMLAVYLCGIALGSIAMKTRSGKLSAPLTFFGVLELLLAVISVVNLYLFAPLDSHWPTSFSGYVLPGVATVLIVFPITFILGMIFPVAGVCYAEQVKRAGSSVGWLYSANTLGSIVGSLMAGFVFIPYIGSITTVILLAVVNACLGLILIGLDTQPLSHRKPVVAVLTIVFVVLAVSTWDRDPFLKTIEKRIYGNNPSPQEKKLRASEGTEIFFHKEGVQGSVTVFQQEHKKRLWIDGIGMTSLCTETKLMAYFPWFYVKNPRDFLVICFGMGTTLKSAAINQDMNVTSVELVPEVYKGLSFFHPGEESVFRQKNVELIVDDGRNYLLFTTRKFDVISIDPAPPVWSAGTVNLYTKEFFTLCKSRLKAHGVLCLWFPGWTKDVDLAVMKTFKEVFPDTTVWSGPHYWGYYVIGTMNPVSESDIVARMKRAFEDPSFVKDIREYDALASTPEKILGLRLWNAKEIDHLTKDAATITDNNPYTEFFLWRVLLGKRGFWGPAREIIEHRAKHATQKNLP